MERFGLPAPMREEIARHAREDAPRECCGVILCREGAPVRLVRLANLYPDIDFYEIDDEAFYALYTAAEAEGLEIGAIYHSHPSSEPVPSARDIEHAGWDSAVYLICGLEDSNRPDLRGFRIVDGAVTEVDLTA